MRGVADNRRANMWRTRQAVAEDLALSRQGSGVTQTSQRGWRTADDDQAICRAAERAGLMFGLAPETAFTPTLASPRVGYWRQFDSAFSGASPFSTGRPLKSF